MSLAAATRIDGVTRSEGGMRFGVKGVGAATWLAQQDVPVPSGPNRIARWAEGGGGRCLRLGNTEFLVERDAEPGLASTHASMPSEASGMANAWILLRSDASFVLDGPCWPRELSQACSFDFTRFAAEPDLVVMTLLAGISVTLVREPVASGTHLALRLWCDASYSDYLQDCLQQLAVPLPGEHR